MIDKIQKDLKAAMLSRDQQTVSVLKLLKSALDNKRIELGKDLEEKDVLAVIRSEAKKRNEAADMYEKGGNSKSADKEKAELEILKAYLPKQLNDEDLKALIEDVEKELGKDANMGMVIKETIARADGRADGGRVSQIIKNLQN